MSTLQSRGAPDHPFDDVAADRWRELGKELPDDLTGLRALDVGCNAGFYSFELARRGADVVGIDVDKHALREARWARKRLGLRSEVEFRRQSVYELAQDPERYDLILLMDVLGHLRHPLLALDVVASKARGTVVVQTPTMPGDAVTVPPPDLPLDRRHELLAAGWPKLAFVECRLDGDPTSWWAPNHACVEAMVRSAGLEVVSRPGHELYLCRARGLPEAVADELASVLER